MPYNSLTGRYYHSPTGNNPTVPPPVVVTQPEPVVEQPRTDPVDEIANRIAPYVQGMSDAEIDAIVDALDLEGLIGLVGLAGTNLDVDDAVSAANAQLAELQVQRDASVGDVLYDLNRTSGRLDESFVNRGLGFSGFRVQSQADLSRTAQQQVQAINQAVIGQLGTINRGFLTDPLDSYASLLAQTRQSDLDQIRAALEAR